MERWAANTLRTLGIILTSGLVIISCLFLILLSMCFGGANENTSAQAVAGGLIVGAILIAIAGIVFVVWLARGISRSKLVEPADENLSLIGPDVNASPVPPPGIPLPPRPEPQFSAPLHPALLERPAKPLVDTPEPQPSLPVHLSSLSRRTLDRLVLALGAQILLSAVAWIFGQLHFWSGRQPYAPRNWTLALLAPYVLYHVPYAVLIYFLLKKPDRRTFAYSIAVPAVMMLQGVFSLGIVGYYFVHEPRGLLLLVLPWLVHIVILLLAYKSIQQVGLHPEPSSIMIAAVTTYLFFSLIHVITPFLYRFLWR